MRSLLLSLLFYLSIQSVLFAQGADNKGEPLSGILKEIGQRYGISIIFTESDVNDIVFSGEISSSTIGNELRVVLQNKNLGFIATTTTEYYVFSIRNLNEEIIKIAHVNLDWNEIISLSEEQNERPAVDTENLQRVEGVVRDGKTSQPINRATIYFETLGTAVNTNESGIFTIELPAGRFPVTISSFGYEIYNSSLIVPSQSNFEANLFESTQELDELVIYAQSFSEKVNNSESGLERVSMKTIEELPAFMGELDILNSITALPGVSSAGEGTNGFNVRGGSNDENLILLDGIPIFNANHLFGFISVFNADIIDEFTLYKGGINSRFGGRSSSVLDITTKRGNRDHPEVNVSIGTVTSKVTAEGPLNKRGDSFIISSRLGYPNFLLSKAPDKAIRESEASFADINFKLSFEPEKDRSIDFTGFAGKDQFTLASDTSFSWTSAGFALIKSKIINPVSSYRLTASTSFYENTIEGYYPNSEFTFKNFVNYSGIKVNFLKIPSDEFIVEYGAESNFYYFNTGKLVPGSAESTINPFVPNAESALEEIGYISVEKEINPKLSIVAGLRASLFLPKGPSKVFDYSNNQNPDLSEVIDTLEYSSTQFYSPYFGLEPRLNFRYSINEQSSIKGGYQLMRQNIHIISNSLSIAPTDFWKLTNSFILPTVSNQVNIGYHRDFNRYYLYTEVFYKSTTNILDYKNGTKIFLNPQIETSLVNTKGQSYGWEVKLEKRGLLNGWISYSFTQSKRFIDIADRLDKDFGDMSFPSDFNKPHNLNTSLNYKLSRRFSLSANFIFSSGRPITVAESAYLYNSQLFTNYTSRNEGNIPSYHRLDLSLIIKGNLKRQKLYDGEFIVSLYNVYSRRNAFSVFYGTTPSGFLPQAYKLSILGSIFPSINYNFKLAKVK